MLRVQAVVFSLERVGRLYSRGPSALGLEPEKVSRENQTEVQGDREVMWDNDEHTDRMIGKLL